MTHPVLTIRPLLAALTLLTLSAALSSCGQGLTPAADSAAVQVPTESAALAQAPSSEGELRSSELTLNPSALVQTRWFSGKVTTLTCTAPWWNQAQINAQLQQNPLYLRVRVSTPTFFLSGSRSLRADFYFVTGPLGTLTFQGTQKQGVLQVDGTQTVLENGVNTPFGSGYVLDYDALGQGTAFRGVLDVKVACGTAGTAGPGTTYPGKLYFHTDRV